MRPTRVATWAVCVDREGVRPGPAGAPRRRIASDKIGRRRFEPKEAIVPCPADQFSGDQFQNWLFANWLGNVRVRSERHFVPDSLESLVRVVADAAQSNRRVRAIGRGWSFESIAAADPPTGWTVRLDKLNAFKDELVTGPTSALNDTWRTRSTTGDPPPAIRSPGRSSVSRPASVSGRRTSRSTTAAWPCSRWAAARARRSPARPRPPRTAATSIFDLSATSSAQSIWSPPKVGRYGSNPTPTR